MDISFDLGDIDWITGDFEEIAENTSLTQLLNIPTQQLVKEEGSSANSRFADPVSTADIKNQQQQRIPKKTRQSNTWALNLWRDWARNRNARPETQLEFNCTYISDNICDLDDSSLNFWLQRFIVEIRRKDGTNYPANTLTQVVSASQRYLRDKCSGRQINFYKDDDTVFQDFRKALDARMKYLTSQGIGVDKKRADPVTAEDEVQMWNTGVFSLSSASGLSNAVFFYNGKAFAFRGMDEHRQCAAEQFQINYDHENNRQFVMYTPRVSKNVQGGLKHRRIEVSPVKHYDDPTNPRCLVKLYETYLSLIPSRGQFYRKPLETVSSFGPRFGASTIPVNQMSKMFKGFYAEAGIDTTGRTISNHSGRVTCCTRLYNEGFSDKAVISRGHHRSNAVHTYQREQFKILNDISTTLGAPRPSDTSDNASKPSTSENASKLSTSENASKLSVKSEKASTCNEQDIKRDPTTAQTQDTPQPVTVETQDTLQLVVPESINKVGIVKNGKKIELII